LISKAAGGDCRAFEKLISTHLKVIYNYICIHVKNEEDVSDIIQETMLAVWNGLKNFRQDSAFRTWVIGITRRKIYDFYREKYKNTVIPVYEAESALVAGDLSDELTETIDVSNAVLCLSKPEQEIVFLAFGAQMTYQEISEIVGVPVGTVKSRMHAIKSKLRKRLEKE